MRPFEYMAETVKRFRADDFCKYVVKEAEAGDSVGDQIDTFCCHPQIQNLILYSKLPLKCV